jgi:hypothetical protein
MQTWTWKEFISHQEPIQNNLINSSQLKNYIYIYTCVCVCVCYVSINGSFTIWGIYRIILVLF